MECPYNIKTAEMDEQDMMLIETEIEKMNSELKKRSDLKNLLLLHFMMTCKIEHELKSMSKQGKNLCIKEIRETLKQRIPELFSRED